MSEIKIHIFHIGKVCVAPELPFGGEHYSALKASGMLDRKSKRLWLPVSAYLIECAHGNVLFDCGWYRDMSPHGVFERRAQIRSLGSLPLYFTNQVVVESSAAIDEQLAAQKKSLAWIRARSRERNCVACIANHDSDVKPGAITL